MAVRPTPPPRCSSRRWKASVTWRSASTSRPSPRFGRRRWPRCARPRVTEQGADTQRGRVSGAAQEGASVHVRLSECAQCCYRIGGDVSEQLGIRGDDIRGGRHGPGTDAQRPVLLCAVEARGLALLGTAEANATRKAIRDAEGHYNRARPGGEPKWLDFYTEAELAADLGRCLSDVGEPEQAARHITHALDQYEPWRTRSRCFVRIDLAAAFLMGGDQEHAAACGRDAVHTATLVSSERTRDKLRTLQRRIRPRVPGSPELNDLDQRGTRLLPTPSRNEDTAAR